jgi:hypothetical protein
MTNEIYEVTRESEISNRIVKQLNASVLIATFDHSGSDVKLADLYTSRHSSNKLVAHKTCAPANSQYVATVKIRLTN